MLIKAEAIAGSALIAFGEIPKARKSRRMACSSNIGREF
jgi:hypothetical protein